jgi:hypothetical protein
MLLNAIKFGCFILKEALIGVTMVLIWPFAIAGTQCQVAITGQSSPPFSTICVLILPIEVSHADPGVENVNRLHCSKDFITIHHLLCHQNQKYSLQWLMTIIIITFKTQQTKKLLLIQKLNSFA